MISEEFVVDDRARLLVPQDRHGDTAAIVGPRLDIEFAQGARAEDRIRNDAAPFVESPAALAEQPMDDRERDHALKGFEPAEDEGAVGPRAGERNNEMIASGLSLVAACAGRPRFAARGHPVAERRVGPHEAPRPVVRKVALGAPHPLQKIAHVPMASLDRRTPRPRRLYHEGAFAPNQQGLDPPRDGDQRAGDDLGLIGRQEQHDRREIGRLNPAIEIRLRHVAAVGRRVDG